MTTVKSFFKYLCKDSNTYTMNRDGSVDFRYDDHYMDHEVTLTPVDDSCFTVTFEVKTYSLTDVGEYTTPFSDIEDTYSEFMEEQEEAQELLSSGNASELIANAIKKMSPKERASIRKLLLNEEG
jgi:hypothetical protein